MLHKIRLKPGLDKQSSDTGAEGKWVNGDYMRFRYSYPEKIGGWQQLGSKSLVGAGRDSHSWTDLAGNKYAAIGTNHDITPLDTTRQQTSATITTTTSSATVTITTSSSHGAVAGDIITFASTTVPAGSSYTSADFNSVIYEVISVPTATTITITMSSNEGTGQSGGSVTVDFYYVIGPLTQGYGYGWGTSTFGGRVIPPTVTTLNGAITDKTTTTGITLTSSTLFTAAGKIQVGSELISYTSINASHVLQGAARGASGSTAATHLDAATVYDATSFVGFGSASSSSPISFDP